MAEKLYVGGREYTGVGGSELTARATGNGIGAANATGVGFGICIRSSV